MSFIPGKIACRCSGLLCKSFTCLFLFLIVLMRHKYLSLAGWRDWESSLNRHEKKWYLCQVIILGLSLEIPPQLLNIQKHLAADSQGFTRGLVLLQPCVTTFGSVIKNLYSLMYAWMSMYLFSFISSFGWYMTPRKRGGIIHSHSPGWELKSLSGCFCEKVHWVQGQLTHVNPLSENGTPVCFNVVSLKCFPPYF